MLEQDSVERALHTLGALLAARGLDYEIVVVGGSALLLRGIIRRSTRDLDVLALVSGGMYRSAQPLPTGLERAARDVARELGLAANWLNSGPTAQIQAGGLPEGFEKRVETRTYGTLVVQIAGRIDQIFLKLYAAVDQWPSKSKHLDDLIRLAPTHSELRDATRWVLGQDAGPDFPTLVVATLNFLGFENVDE